MTSGERKACLKLWRVAMPGCAALMEGGDNLSPACGANQVLAGITAYVEVWSSSRTENYSQSFSEHLVNLGAKVTKRFNKQVTHVVFKDGNYSTWNKAVKCGVKLVSVLWVDKCREQTSHVDESLYPAMDPKEALPQFIKKKRRCMQPKDLIIRTPESDRRLAKKFDKMLKELENQKASSDASSFELNGSVLFSPIAVITDRCNAMERRLQEMKDERENLSPTASQMSQTAFDFPCLKPLLENSPLAFADSSVDTDDNVLDTSYEELFGGLEKREGLSTSKNQTADVVQGEAWHSLNVNVETFNLTSLETKASPSSPELVKKCRLHSLIESRGRKSHVKLKMTDTVTDISSENNAFYVKPSAKKESPATDSISVAVRHMASNKVNSINQCNVRQSITNKRCRSYIKRTDITTDKDTEGHSFCGTVYDVDDPSSVTLKNGPNKICKDKRLSKKLNSLDLKLGTLISPFKTNMVKELVNSNLSRKTDIDTSHEFDDFFSSEEVKCNGNSSVQSSVQPRRSPSPPLLFFNQKSKKRRSADLQKKTGKAKKRKTIHAISHSVFSAVERSVQETPIFCAVPEKNDINSLQYLMMDSENSSLKSKEVKANVLKTKANQSDNKTETQCETVLEPSINPFNELKKVTDMSKNTLDESANSLANVKSGSSDVAQKETCKAQKQKAICADYQSVSSSAENSLPESSVFHDTINYMTSQQYPELNAMASPRTREGKLNAKAIHRLYFESVSSPAEKCVQKTDFPETTLVLNTGLYDSSPIENSVQEAPAFSSVLQKQKSTISKCSLINTNESPLTKETELHRKTNLSLDQRAESDAPTNGNVWLEPTVCVSSGLKKVTNAETSNRTKNVRLNLTSGDAVGLCEEPMKKSLLPSAESITTGSNAIVGLSEMLNEQRSKCTEESRKTEKSRKVMRTLVMTSMSSEKQNTVIQVVKQFGGFVISNDVDESTTHVISGSPRRTLNIILGVARGCWILSYDWVLWSLEHGHWIPEEPYELSDHFPGAPICRLQRHLSAAEYCQNFLSSMPPVFISPNSEPPSDKLYELVQICGGKVTKTLRQAKIYIGTFIGKKLSDMLIVSEKWLLDCVTQHKLHPLENYLLIQ